VPVIKDLPELLNTTPANAAWVLTATLLAGAVAAPIMGRLGDLYGAPVPRAKAAGAATGLLRSAG
jgi:MFS family permease